MSKKENKLVKKYFENKGLKCLYCGSDNITAGHIVVDGCLDASCLVTCNDCHCEWRDLYKLVGVLP